MQTLCNRRCRPGFFFERFCSIVSLPVSTQCNCKSQCTINASNTEYQNRCQQGRAYYILLRYTCIDVSCKYFMKTNSRLAQFTTSLSFWEVWVALLSRYSTVETLPLPPPHTHVTRLGVYCQYNDDLIVLILLVNG